MSTTWSVRLAAELRAVDERASGIAGGLAAAELNWRPSPAEWSIGQCLDHLRVANAVYLGAMEPALRRPPGAPVAEIRPGWFGRWFIRSQIDPRPGMQRGRAPKKIVPVVEVDATVLERFLRSNAEARSFVERVAGYDVNRIRFRNPFVPLIRFTLGTGLEILVRHQRRHLLQAERVNARRVSRGAGS